MEKLREMVQTEFGADRVEIASIGGTATWGIPFPEKLSCAGEASVVERFDGFDTPFGKSGEMKLLKVGGEPVLRFPLHGWNSKKPSVEDSLSVFWVLKQMGVSQVVVDASVGGVTAKPWDVVIAHDFIDTNSSPLVTRFAAEIGVKPWRRLVEPFCPRLRDSLIETTEKLKREGTEESHHELGQIYHRGVYHSIHLGVFETAAELAMYQEEKVDIVGQSTGQEAMLARVCDMCFGGIYIVANYAEGLPGDWNREGMDDLYRQCGIPMGVIVWWTLEKLVKSERTCDCARIAEQSSHEGLPVPGA